MAHFARDSNADVIPSLNAKKYVAPPVRQEDPPSAGSATFHS